MEDRQSIEGTLGRRLLLGEMLARNARKFPNKEAVVYGDLRLSYREFNARVNRLANAMLDLGIGKGSKVAVLSFNCNEFLEVYFALGKIGGVTVPLNFRLHGEELIYVVNHSDAEAFVMGETFVPMVEGMKQDFPNVRTYASISKTPVEGMLHYESWISSFPDDEPLVLVDEDDALFIMYTAGTTGRAKGAVLTHKNQLIMWMLTSIYAASEPGIHSLTDYVCFAVPPIFHLAAFGWSLFTLFVGATLVLPTEVFDPTNVMKTIEEEKVSAILLVPAMPTSYSSCPIWRSMTRPLSASGYRERQFCLQTPESRSSSISPTSRSSTCSGKRK